MSENDRVEACANQECRPEPSIGIGAQPMQQAQEVKIVKVLNGYVLAVGCKRVVFEQKNQMLLELARYFDNPALVEKEYMEKFGII